jgi:hypothetical protein
MPRSKALQARKQAAREQDENRRHIEALLEAGYTAEELGLHPVRLPPALAFIRERLNEIKDGGTDEMLAHSYDAFEALLISDVPLDPISRRWIRDVLHGLRFPAETTGLPDEKRVAMLQKHFEERGERAPKKRALKELGLKADTLKKRRQRSPTRDKKALPVPPEVHRIDSGYVRVCFPTLPALEHSRWQNQNS